MEGSQNLTLNINNVSGSFNTQFSPLDIDFNISLAGGIKLNLDESTSYGASATFNVTLAWIEYFNRLVGVCVGLLIAATALLAIIRFRRNPRILWPTLLAALLVAFQGWLGAAVVASELHSLVVTLHLLLALIIALLLVYVNQETYHLDRTVGRGGPRGCNPGGRPRR